MVGGAVRDELLGRTVVERDWVVVGSTPEEMRAKGYQPVGKDFPVFLHPKTHEEYALARTERKTGKGYKGFHFYATPDVSLTEDLIRRDLTINAMAKNIQTGDIIDPYEGQSDLRKRLLKHVSAAFSEDPVRILRVARFASQLPEFSVHTDTNALMKQMVESGEVDALVSERVWKELSRALIARNPKRFFDVLTECTALRILFPAINDQNDFSHFEKAIALSTKGTVRFAALLATVPVKAIQTLCTRYRTPREFTDLALQVAKYHGCYAALNPTDARQIWDILKYTDAFRRPERFEEWIITAYAVHPAHNHTTLLTTALNAAKNVDTRPLLEKNYQGKAFADALQQLQINAIEMSRKL